MPRIPKIIRAIVSLGLLGVLFSLVEWRSFLDQLKEISLLPVLLTLPLFFLGVYLSVLRWHSILEFLRIPPSKVVAFRLYLEGAFLNNFLPASVGGDVYKYLILTRDKTKSKSAVAASLIYERGTGFAVFIFLNILLIGRFYHLIMQVSGLRIIEILIALIGMTVLVLFIGKEYFALKWETFLAYLSVDSGRFSIISFLLEKLAFAWIIPAAIYSMLFTAIIIAIRFFCLMAFGVDMDLLTLLFFSTIIQIAGILPISLNAVGVSEGLIVFLYGLVGISPEISLGAALIERVCVILVSSIGALTLHRDQVQSHN
jgi:glycosyltransferase 2 family protein